MSKWPIKKLILSHSSCTTFESCTRKFEFSKMYGDSLLTRDNSFPGDVGNAIHAGFQNYLEFRDERKAIVALALAYPHDDEFRDSENKSRSLEACYASLMAMINHPITEDYDLIYIKMPDGKERAAIEVPFAFEITGTKMPIPVFYVGKIDAILKHRRNGNFIIDDIKSTRQYMSDISARYEFDEQTVPYGICLEHLLGRDIDQFEVSFLNVFIDLTDPKVVLNKMTKTQNHLTDWMMGMSDRIERIRRYYEAEWFPRATDGHTCMAFKRPCWAVDFCSERNIEQIQKMLRAEPRDGFFHDGLVPWVLAKLDLGGLL